MEKMTDSLICVRSLKILQLETYYRKERNSITGCTSVLLFTNKKGYLINFSGYFHLKGLLILQIKSCQSVGFHNHKTNLRLTYLVMVHKSFNVVV